jgi:methylmalonyl-CoA mutase N-terminal domain/subunit
VALRTQQIIAHESGVADSVDPLAGSYLIEYLTDEIERLADEYIAKIDDMGGALAAIERGYMQREIQNAAYAYQKAVEAQDEVLVGVNQFQVDEHMDLERLEVDPQIEAQQRVRLAAIRERRDAVKTSELLSQLGSTARSKKNLIPVILACVENDITLGEICNLLREIWGEYQPQNLL